MKMNDTTSVVLKNLKHSCCGNYNDICPPGSTWVCPTCGTHWGVARRAYRYGHRPVRPDEPTNWTLHDGAKP